MITTSEQNWVYEQLEPGQLAQGTHRRFKPLTGWKYAAVPMAWPTDAEIAEDERLQDEFLSAHGVPTGGRQQC